METSERREICSKPRTKTRRWRHSGVVIVNFEQISYIVLLFTMLTLNKGMPAGRKLEEIRSLIIIIFNVLCLNKFSYFNKSIALWWCNVLLYLREKAQNRSSCKTWNSTHTFILLWVHSMAFFSSFIASVKIYFSFFSTSYRFEYKWKKASVKEYSIKIIPSIKAKAFSFIESP